MNENELKEFMHDLMRSQGKAHFQHEFADFNYNDLFKMSPKELAAWQAKYPMDSPQYIIALQEWNRRALVEQIKSTRWAAFMGFIGAIAGAILAVVIPLLLSTQKTENKVSIQKQTEYNKTTQSTDKKPTDIKLPIIQKP